MTLTESQLLIAWWGAGLSTLLAVVRFAEYWRDRFRIEVGYNFTSSEDVGNSIQIRNLSSKPIILSWWELVYVSGRWPRRIFEEIAGSEYDASDLRIEPQSTLKLNFVGQHHFASGHKALRGRRIFIRLHVAGRKPILKLVYPS